MSETLPGELRYDPDLVRWYVRCARCPETWGLARWTACADDDEGAARYVEGCGWRCIGARWCCARCAP